MYVEAKCPKHIGCFEEYLSQILLCFSGDTMELICKYDLGRDHIYSVKWYKVGTVQYSTVQYSILGAGQCGDMALPPQRQAQEDAGVPHP